MKNLIISKKVLYWVSQLLGWFFYILVVGIYNVFTGNQISTELIFSLFAIYATGIFLSHSYRAIILRYQWLNFPILRLVMHVFMGTLVIGIVGYVLQFILLEVIIADSYLLSLSDAFQKIINWIFLLWVWSLLYFVFHYIDNYKKEQIKNLEWQAAKNQIELNKLKSQLNPHFIFNSMNSIRALVDENPKLAKDAINQLANVLRNSLLMGKEKLISLQEEMKIVNDYLSLEKTRFEERLTIAQHISPESLSYTVPPLMLQTLVENGIKHGISKLPEGGTIEIRSTVKDSNLEIAIYNNGTYDSKKQSETGFGIANTIQRLKLIYGKTACFNISNKENKVLTELTIPQKTIL